jgi:hypothetical protein
MEVYQRLVSGCAINLFLFRLYQNALKEGNAMSAGGRGAMVAGKWAGIKTAKIMLLQNGLYGLSKLWNTTMFPEEEKQMTDYERRNNHLILGKRSDGSLISVRGSGALGDAMDFFSLRDPIQSFQDYASGEKKPSDIPNEILKATGSKLYGAMSPFVKTGVEAVSGLSPYPDITHPRVIRDPWEHVARTFAMNIPYKYLTGLPSEGLSEDVLNLGTYRSDVGQNAFFNTIKRVDEFIEANGGSTKGTYLPKDRQNYLYYWKLAKVYGDQGAEQKYWQKYLDSYNGNVAQAMKGLRSSITHSDPLIAIAPKDRQRFIDSLNDQGKRELQTTRTWQKTVFKI